jgi:predicted metalloenzyme YecM
MTAGGAMGGWLASLPGAAAASGDSCLGAWISGAIVGAAACGSCVTGACLLRLLRGRQLLLTAPRSPRHGDTQPPSVFELKGQYYQILGHAWDHQIKDFKVVYRPLYHCAAAEGRFEAHTLACSHFERWDAKFRRLSPEEVAQLPAPAAAMLLPGPFTFDPAWSHACKSLPLPPGTASRSGVGASRSHELPTLEQLLGGCGAFIDQLSAALHERGLDALGRGYEMDHVCFRCETVAQYGALVGALVPGLGVLLVESMIGGRPIATVQLRQPIEHRGWVVRCIEVPCPKPGRHYPAGLEHAELVVGQPGDGVEGNAALLRWMAECDSDPAIRLGPLDTRALHKPINADVSVGLAVAGKRLSVKFHQRPLYEVVAYEISHHGVDPVPEGYFDMAREAEATAAAAAVSSSIAAPQPEAE